MNRRVTTALLFSLLPALPSAIAQSPAPNSVPSAVVAPSQEGTTPIRANRDAASDADARHCLDFASNLQIITCAEKYRAHERKAQSPNSPD